MRGCGVGRPGAVVAVVVLVALLLAGIGSSPAVAAPTWNPVEAPIPPNAGSTNASGSFDPFNAVACPVAGSCVAVGSDGDQALIDTLSGGTWSFTPAPLPADGGGDAYLHSLSCPALGSCMAVGTYIGQGGFQGLIETLSDGIWTPTTMPAPANSVFPSEPNATGGEVSCPAVGSCVAIWGYEDTTGNLGNVIETLSDGTWTPLEAPLPANENPEYRQSDLTDLTCPAPGSCVAVGTYNIGQYESGPYGLGG